MLNSACDGARRQELRKGFTEIAEHHHRRHA
jgi:hypothetical protein